MLVRKEKFLHLKDRQTLFSRRVKSKAVGKRVIQ